MYAECTECMKIMMYRMYGTLCRMYDVHNVRVHY
jgi:hypothetical protein